MEKSMKVKLEYLWLDGYDTPNIRSKTKYVELEEVKVGGVPEWGFDGSSTKQADGDNSDCILKPVKVYRNTTEVYYFDADSYIVLCEVMNPDGTPHESNTRANLRELYEQTKDAKMWFGIEQEYVMMNPETSRPFGWPETGYPPPQGRYYCGVGSDAVRMRNIVESHAQACIEAGIPLGGTNAEVMLSQWEYQVGTATTLDVCDDLWVARFLLERIAESEGVAISLTPKPIQGDWNGSGAHINFSTQYMRENANYGYINEVILVLENYHQEHINEYGSGNNERLTGQHETQHIDEFSSGVSDRGASIRIPTSTAENDMGYLEDRRPAANMDPYRAVARLVETIAEAEVVQVI